MNQTTEEKINKKSSWKKRTINSIVVLTISGTIYMVGITAGLKYNNDFTSRINEQKDEINLQMMMGEEKIYQMREKYDEIANEQRQLMSKRKIKKSEFHNNMNSIDTKFFEEREKILEKLNNDQIKVDSLNHRLYTHKKNPWNSWYDIFFK